MNGLAKIGGNSNNHRALVRSGSIPLAVALMAYHPEDLHVCETVLMLLLPFSFNLEITRLMSEAGAVPVLVSAMVCTLVRVALSCPVMSCVVVSARCTDAGFRVWTSDAGLALCRGCRVFCSVSVHRHTITM